MKIKVLGPGCRNCKTMYEMALAAVNELQISDAEIEYVKDMSEITKYIMTTPGLVVDEVVVHEGKPLPSYERVKEIFSGK
ncbi:redox-active disulfide protein 2 [Denitrovibrio acetiphilus DSM 12809]|jgi:small redox-active disulfide protein 2|uniref:Redox-active disulfide protein 2 n=1 Tax=Denitrovibrio acetiphilus (strain DSM 12809 / NBRC 114555 / N2460) TaxID=522772 RepID=D4H2Z9_DENA2|nr:thioredoxin family protein [Denitrovibrio acetiphilus]ADD69022.1 redox-active disulfide protein 2 [Denitrovibrio acetiphilus DSM 12809]